MPEKYTVKITQQAQEQIREIVSYIRFTLQAPETAMKMLDTLQEETKKVQIIGAVYGRKDQRHQLSNLDMF